jgi:hypothetical protein
MYEIIIGGIIYLFFYNIIINSAANKRISKRNIIERDIKIKKLRFVKYNREYYSRGQ